MYSGKERVVRFRGDQQSLFDEYLIDQHQGGDEPDAFDHRQIRIVHGAERLAHALRDGDSVGSIATGRTHDPDDSHVNLSVSNDRPPAEKIVAPVRPPTRISPPRKPRPASVPQSTPSRNINVDVFSWRRFATGAALGSLATAAALALISVLV